LPLTGEELVDLALHFRVARGTVVELTETESGQRAVCVDRGPCGAEWRFKPHCPWLLLSNLPQTCPYVISRETSVGRKARHHLTDLRFFGTLAVQPPETLRETGVAGREAVGKPEAAQEGILDGPRPDAAHAAEQAGRVSGGKVPKIVERNFTACHCTRGRQDVFRFRSRKFQRSQCFDIQ